jgi:serine/threonine-protein kinase
MGTVYVGRHQDSGQRTAIKVLAAGLAADEGFRERFASEIETLKKLHHPHIVDLCGFGERDGLLYYAMELVEATSLQEELEAGRRFDWREVSRIGVQVCAALKHAHDHGIIHRDLKPANLLLDAEDRVKLTDFGIARFFGQRQLTVAGGVLGTADYMAPEQAEGRPTTVRSDLYSLGCVLYALLAGRPPFCGKSLPEVLHMVRFERPLPVRRLAPAAPSQMEDILEQLLDKDPQRRIPTALALSHRLRAMEHLLTVHRAESEPSHGQEMEQGDTDAQAEPSSPPISHDAGLAGTIVDLRNRPPDDPIPAGRTIEGPVEADRGPADSHSLSVDGSTGVQWIDDAADRPGDEASPPPTAGQFTAIDGQRRRQSMPPAAVPTTDGTAWWKIGLAMAVLLAVMATVWYSRRPPTADQLYRQIQNDTKQDRAPSADRAEADIQRFLTRFPSDPRRDELCQLLEQVKRQALRVRLEPAVRQDVDLAGLSPAEQAYAEAMQIRRTSREAAAERLEGLIALFGSDPKATATTQRCVALAREDLKALEASIERTIASHRHVLEARLRNAEQQKAADVEGAQAIWRGIIRLYADKPWAEDLVQRAREKLSGRSDGPAAP